MPFNQYQDRYDKAKSLLKMMRQMSRTFGQDRIAIESEFFLKEEEAAANLAVQLFKENAHVKKVEFNPSSKKWTVRSTSGRLSLHNQETLNWLERMLQLAEEYQCSFRSKSPDFDIQLF